MTVILRRSILVITTLGLFVAVLLWLFHDPVRHLVMSVPGMDRTGSAHGVINQEVKIGEMFTFFGTTPEIPGPGWPGFRGPGRDNISGEPVALTDRWDQLPQRILWKTDLGEGHAAPAIYRGRVYLLDYDEKNKQDILRCFALMSGKELWRRGYKVHLKRNHGLSRTIPAVNDHIVVTIGPKCQVMCADRLTGDLKWGIDLVRQYETEVPFWYTGQCPLIDGDTVILAPAGKALLIAVDGATGKILRETPNPFKWKMSHASVIKTTVEGKAMYVYFAIGGICGVSAHGSDAGKILWSLDTFAPAVVAPSPVALEQGRILLTAGYGAGTALIRISRDGAAWKAELLQQFRPQEGIASEQQTPVFYRGTVFAILPKDAGGARNQFVAVSPSDARNIMATSGKSERFGLGPYMVADDKFYILNDDGEMTIAKATANTFVTLDKAKLLQGTDAWGPLALSGGLLLARDSKQMICIDIRKK